MPVRNGFTLAHIFEDFYEKGLAIEVCLAHTT